MNNKKNEITRIIQLAYQNHTQNNFDLAESLYKKILKLDQNNVDANYLLGTLLLQKRSFDEAIKTLNQALEINKTHIHAMHNLAYAFSETGKFNEAEKLLSEVISKQPKHLEAYYNLGNVYKNLGKLNEAEDSYKKSISINPNNAKAYNNLGNILKDLGKLTEAINAYNKAIELQFNHSRAYHNLGNTYKQIGDFTKAKECYENSYKYEPSNLETLFTLSELDEQILNLKLKEKIKKIMENKKISGKDYAYGNFLLSKYELKNKNFESEFDYLIKGHHNYFEFHKKKYKKGVDYWLNKLPENEEIIKIDEINNIKIEDDENIKPIFIVGTPRCGSTLIEKIIISGEKEISSGEEAAVISHVMGKKILSKVKIYSNISEIRKEIIEKFNQKKLLNKKNDNVFTDKSLDNFFFIGLIKKIFPSAKIIHCKRNYLSSIISIIKNNLGDVTWAHKPEHIFKYFDIYYKKINYYKKMYPNFIYELELETFVNNPEIESKKLMKFCELPWSKKCLEFYKRKDLTSRTASNIQIRQPIYKDLIQKHNPYKQFLDAYGKKYEWYL